MTAAAVVLAGTVIAGTLLTAAPASASCSVTDLDCVPGAPVPTTPKPATANSIKFSYQLAQLPTATPGQVGGPDMDVTNESTTSPVVLSGCGSVATGAAYPGISAYEWTVGSAAPVYTSTCQWTWQRPVSATGGSTPVTLTVIPTKGTPFSSTKTISYRDVVIASVGDSAASGQGAFQYNISPRCYRSGYAASAQAALHAQQTLGSAGDRPLLVPGVFRRPDHLRRCRTVDDDQWARFRPGRLGRHAHPLYRREEPEPAGPPARSAHPPGHPPDPTEGTVRAADLHAADDDRRQRHRLVDRRRELPHDQPCRARGRLRRHPRRYLPGDLPGQGRSVRRHPASTLRRPSDRN